ncbi:hypothetical protein M407DRAFT_241447 [Tulasnella calospora MUT 4182]|uniref:Uncharacterized protein n=1 Tax=Tulasnella calospora MUT 4182 TaxID=1051891 RepID=A0A0C3QT98_9AGAM|nr:hypothetical protein M407DRAFT_241447 [Tulasnella calospora MUT 4182]
MNVIIQKVRTVSKSSRLGFWHNIPVFVYRSFRLDEHRHDILDVAPFGGMAVTHYA